MQLIETGYTYEWLTLGAVLIVIELLTPAFGFIFVGLAGVIAAGVSALGFNLVFQLATFLTVILISFIFLRPRLLELLYKNDKKLPANRAEALIGKTGVVTEPLNESLSTGRVTILGEDWAAESTEEIEAGAKVEVVGFNSTRLIIKRKV